MQVRNASCFGNKNDSSSAVPSGARRDFEDGRVEK